MNPDPDARYTTFCNIDGCRWQMSYPREARPGADLVLARHMADVHVEEAERLHAPTPDRPETGITVER